ncbi:hypothetical protein [Streptomyces capoamus]|uniref:Uncharacterized protein n=1 Tax=Streptomyces capoamus TaxID=68183 RepID=A0A919C0B2_9ACTN|nr:hypothetical protein [Streptomyces capoamus]GGW17541.1 hypothetical protein GCM10010501_38550 [Streptomyces libani subsp. rufus]GHG36477.1 hypothetical protein GCM10018980_07270 [Streptomyces capoamus]
MADGGDFYSGDRPENPKLEEDRPRGGGPEDRPQTGHRHVWVWWLVVAIVILILFFLFI